MGQRILVVDDEPDLLELVRVNLSQAGFEVDTAETGRHALERARRSAPDLLILDLMLPDLSGTEVCRHLRADAAIGQIPIIMLTARADEVDRVVGLEIGADDYVTKPFSPRELTLRVRAVLRRRQPATSGGSQVLERAALRLDPERHRCFVEQTEIELTAKEFALLPVLIVGFEQCASRDLREQSVGELDASLERTARAIAAELGDRALDARRDDELAALAERSARLAGVRVTLIDAAGSLRADSDVVAANLHGIENHAEREEVKAAAAGGVGHATRMSHTVGRTLRYVAVPAPGGGVVRVSDDLAE